MRDVLTTRAGWSLIVLGNFIGFLFAVLVLAVSAISFPLLLDRDVGAAVALLTSLRAVARNPITMGVWGLIVAVALFIGSLPFFLGLTVVVPILGHATWHLYRKVIEPAESPLRRSISTRKGAARRRISRRCCSPGRGNDRHLISASHSSSVSTATPSLCASPSLEPAPGPATT